MQYIPNLIPKNARVLEDYFRVSSKDIRKNKAADFAGLFFGIIFILNAIIRLAHPLFALPIAFLGLMLLPPGHAWIEKNFRFRLTAKIKAVTITALLVLILPLARHYDKVDKAESEKQQLLAKLADAAKKRQQRAERQRADSLAFYIDKTRESIQKQQAIRAARTLSYALNFVKSDEDKSLIEKEKVNISNLEASLLIKAKKYAAALTILSTLLSHDPVNTSILYNRALCYSKIGKIADAVQDCKQAMELGDKQAVKLYDKINPIRKRVAYYETRCCDGTSSSASGRGACSHHGGVCDWNAPVYEEYRKY